VSDNGCGFNLDNVPPDHFGLTNLRERAQAIGAVLEITSRAGCDDTPGGGTRVRAVWQGKEESDE
jgi:signal transduction histidine kinase